MFLNELNQELGVAYINLLVEFALVDNKVGKKERELIQEALKEMNMNNEDLEDLIHEDAIDILKGAGDRIVNIVFFELIRVSLVDLKHQMSEVTYLDDLANEFNIPRVKRFKMADYFYKHSNYSEKDLKKMESLKEEAEALLS